MNKFLSKHAPTIMLMLLCLVLGGFSSSLFSSVFPKASEISKEIIEEVVGDAVDRHNGPLVDTIDSLELKVDVLYYNAADEWVRLIDKQYDKLVSNASNLYWLDVEYVLSKWEKMPIDYMKPPLEAKMLYIRNRYTEHIGK